MVVSDRINQLKLLGLVLIWASFLLALGLPAAGVSELRLNPVWIDSANANDAKIASHRIPVWQICLGSGCAGLMLWLVTPARPTKTKFPRRKR